MSEKKNGRRYWKSSFSGALILLFFGFISFYKIFLEKKVERESEIGGEGISSFEKLEIEGVNQWVLSRGSSRKNPVLLILHGGPGAGAIGFEREFGRELEKEFIVVNWDQRGAGKTFGIFTIGDELSPEAFLSDTEKVVRHLKEKFHVQKIYLLGHSWGGYLGAIYAHRHPENLTAFIAIGPVVSGQESARISYQVLVQQLKKEPGEVAREIPSFDDYMKNRRFWLNRIAGGMFHGIHSRDESSYLAGIMFASPEYSIADTVEYLPGILVSAMHLRKYFFQMNLFEQAPSIDVPVYFATGRFDNYGPPEILTRYASVLKAPGRKITIFENCAHAPHFEEPAQFAAFLNSVKQETGN